MQAFNGHFDITRERFIKYVDISNFYQGLVFYLDLYVSL